MRFNCFSSTNIPRVIIDYYFIFFLHNLYFLLRVRIHQRLRIPFAALNRGSGLNNYNTFSTNTMHGASSSNNNMYINIRRSTVILNITRRARRFTHHSKRVRPRVFAFVTFGNVQYNKTVWIVSQSSPRIVFF